MTAIFRAVNNCVTNANAPGLPREILPGACVKDKAKNESRRIEQRLLSRGFASGELHWTAVPKAEHVLLGVDIGGTKAAAGLVNAAGEVLFTARRRMVVGKTAEDGLRSVTDAIEAVLSNRRARPVSCIG